MANSIYDFLPTEANDSQTGGVNTAEGQNPSTVNDAQRNWKQLVAKFIDDLGGVNSVGGTATAVTVTAAQDWDGYGSGAGQIDNGAVLALKMGAAATGAATLAVNALTAKKIRKQGDVAIAAGDWVQSGIYLLRYDTAYDSGSGAWVLLNPEAPTPPSASDTVAGIVELATAAEWRTGTDTTRALNVKNTWDSAAYVNLGATLTGNLTLDLGSFINGYGTATGNITFDAVSNAKNQSGQVEITASGANRTVGFNTSAFCTPNNVSLGTIASGKKVSFSYAPTQSGKVLLIRLGEVA